MVSLSDSMIWAVSLIEYGFDCPITMNACQQHSLYSPLLLTDLMKHVLHISDDMFPWLTVFWQKEHSVLFLWCFAIGGTDAI